MHIALICRSFPHHRAGGMEWHSQDIVEGLIEAGHTVSVFTSPLPTEPALAPLAVNGELITFGNQSGQYDISFALELRRRIARECQRLGVDVVHAQGFAGVFARKPLRGGPPLVTTIHGTLWSETPLRSELRGLASRGEVLGLKWRYKHRVAFSGMWKKFIRGANSLIVDSQYTVQELHREVGRFQPPATLVPLGFHLDRFPVGDREAARRKWGVAQDETLLVSLGRIEETKGFRLLLDAFMKQAKSHPKAKMILAGDGPLRAPLLKAIDLHGLADRVQMPGRVSMADSPGLLQVADYFLNADLGAPAFGLVNAEALVMGTPVLASNVGAHPEVIDRALFGKLVRPTSLAAWERFLQQALESPQEKPEDRAERMREARDLFCRDRMIYRLTEVYRKAANNYATPLPISSNRR